MDVSRRTRVHMPLATGPRLFALKALPARLPYPGTRGCYLASSPWRICTADSEQVHVGECWWACRWLAGMGMRRRCRCMAGSSAGEGPTSHAHRAGKIIDQEPEQPSLATWTEH